jgi:DNA topoisomerase-1
MGDFCYKITGDISNEDIITKRIQKLYEKPFDGNPPIMIVISDTENMACVKLNKRGKKVMEIIHEIHAKIKKDIIINDNGKKITISPPIKFTLNQHQWWAEGSNTKKEKEKWTTLSHNGPYLPSIEKYTPHKAPLIYQGKKYVLTPDEEKAVNLYAKRLISEDSPTITIKYTEDPVFNKNYFTSLKKYFTKEHALIFKDFSKIDFSEIVEKLKQIKESETKEQKEKKKAETLKRKYEYGYAQINGIKEAVGNFTVEPMGIFLGRGKNPNRGEIKREIEPEDITINIGSEAKIPKAPNGHSWGHILHDKNLSWLASWKDTISGDPKYVYLSQEGQLKGKSDLIKYEKSRKLQRNIDLVRKGYTQDINGTDIVRKQLGTVLYLIDNFGFRVGGAKDESDVDTVGASTLRVEHVQVLDKNNEYKILFDFLGKDSIRFYKEIIVPKNIAENISLFIQGKKGTDLLFDRITALDINEYLKTFDKDFSAKVFRTKLASMIMYENLKKVKILKTDKDSDKKVKLDKVNALVAESLNHKRTVPIKTKLKIQSLKDELKQLKKDLKEAKKVGKGVNVIQKKIETRKRQIESKSDTLSVAINTSKNSYIDPRILISWGQENELPISKIYTPVMQRKFAWALNITEEGWDYLKTPILQGMEKLEPISPDQLKTRKTPVPREKTPKGNKTPKVKKVPTKPPKTVLQKKTPIKSKEKQSEKENITEIEGKSKNYQGVISFYKNGQEINGYSLNNILNFTNKELEEKEDYIQYLFPLYRTSLPNAFSLDAETVKLFKNDDTIRYHVFKAYKRILDFYGYDIIYSKGDGLMIKRNRELTSGEGLLSERNYIRISRILRFLMLINMKILGYMFLLGICEDLTYNKELVQKIKKQGSLDMWIKIVE